MSRRLAHRVGFLASIPCVATPPGVVARSTIPPPAGAVITTYANYRKVGYTVNVSIDMDGAYPATGPVASDGSLPVFGAGMGPAAVGAKRSGHVMRADFRAAGKETTPPLGSVFVSEDRCGGCHGRGRCLAQPDDHPHCLCVDGAYGLHCEMVCTNDCSNDCSGKGRCLHGFCKCVAGWFGVDCSSSLAEAEVDRSLLKVDEKQMGRGPIGVSPFLLKQLPPPIRQLVRRLRRSVYVYDLPPRVIQTGTEMWSSRFWGKGSFEECDPVHARRIYQAQSIFDHHLLHDSFVRTLDPSQASLFYVPTFLMQRITWGGNVRDPLLRIYEHIRYAHPHWNASGGRDHVWFIFGERMVCDVPDQILDVSIILGHWGGSREFVHNGKRHATDCLYPHKDIVVPPVTPIQHDLAKYREKLLPAMLEADRSDPERSGPLLLFAGGIFSFGASQDNMREGGIDTKKKQEKWQERADKDSCATPESVCREIYSMGVRQAIWRQRLWAEPDMRIVSAGIPDYLTAVPQARFCLHTEGNSWGTRLIDYMAMECIPVIVNDGMIFPFHSILPYSKFSLHWSKRDIPQIANRLRSFSNETQVQMRAAIRLYKRSFVWWRPEGLAYEYTLASLSARIKSLGLRKYKVGVVART